MSASKKQLKKTMDRLANQYQMEILDIVAQLLGYKTKLSSSEKDGVITHVLQGEEKDSKTYKKVHKWLEVTKVGDKADIRFEHFESVEDLELEQTKFLALAQKMGLQITAQPQQIKGKPISSDAVHRDFFVEKVKTP